MNRIILFKGIVLNIFGTTRNVKIAYKRQSNKHENRMKIRNSETKGHT